MRSFEKFQPRKETFCQLCLYLVDFNDSLQVTFWRKPNHFSSVYQIFFFYFIVQTEYWYSKNMKKVEKCEVMAVVFLVIVQLDAKILVL
jgi:hypothetical protein